MDNGHWRGPIDGVVRISRRAGILSVCILAILAGLIVLGISMSGHRRTESSDAVQSITRGSEQHDPWWTSVPSVLPPPPRQPVALPTPARIVLPTPAHITLSEEPIAPAPEHRYGDEERGGPSVLERRERDHEQVESAMKSPIDVRVSGPGGNSAAESASGPPQGSAPAQGPSGGVPSGDILPSIRMDAVSPYRLGAGSSIPATLISGINADLPGLVDAQVRANVYDTVSGAYLLIPQGSRLVGRYDSHIVQGQRRVLVAWSRLLFPDGSSLDLLNMPSGDAAGYAGFGAKVDDHFGRVLGTALLMSVIAAGAQLSQPQRSTAPYAAPDTGQTIAGAVGSQIANTATQVTQRDLNIAPTLEVPVGYRFNVIVDRDIVLAAPYGDNGGEP